MGTPQLAQQPEPKYWHLKTVLSAALDSEFSVGQALPNERALAARFGVARATLRQALDQLELEGRLQRRRGIGTTVAPPRVGVDVGPGALDGPGGPGDAWTTTGWAREPAPPAVAEALGLPRREPVEAVHRLLTSHGLPVATERLFVPAALLPERPGAAAPRPAASGEQRGLDLLGRLRAQGPDGQDRSVELGSAGAAEARRLDQLPGAPVLLVTTRYARAGRVLAVSLATYRADTCRLTFGGGDAPRAGEAAAVSVE
ncbi:GntR family transcriptional regulator [Streptomyces hoynatensis]|uniref:GntR family transcriptional regulator n=1 Tax=Streptomyces hoynatensis TaxID=1141874 RepID=A0A3A9ZA77_9ACTN|nr:GntR family transcriptional regulator [Streptomyces hoynatensis]RKN45078.1 GntR family transcriptional regulator [Streptomyces hoynatensis]